MEIDKLMFYCVLLLNWNFGSCKICHETSETDIDCSGRGLNKVPQNLSVNITSLNLRFNNITVLFAHDFIQLKNLQYLLLGVNPITTIHNAAFVGLSNLLTLELFRHELNYTKESFPDDVFQPLTSLQTLILRSDMSRFEPYFPLFPDKPFERLNSLINLNIDTTPFIVFGKGFSNLTNLLKLDVGEMMFPNTQRVHCTIRSLSNETFKNFSGSLTFLSFDSCTVDVFETGVLVPFPFLKTFFMNRVSLVNGNLLDLVQAFSVYEGKNVSNILITNLYMDFKMSGNGYILDGKVLSNICIEHLQLKNVGIVEFNLDTVLFPPSLLSKCIRHLNFENNEIVGTFSKFDVLLLFLLPNIEIVELAGQKKFNVNHFKELRRRSNCHQSSPVPIPVVIPPKVKKLDISGMPNRIGELIDLYVFRGENMRLLNMSYCGLEDFNHTIYGLENLEILDFSFNDLSTLNVDFFKTFPNLKELRLSEVLLDQTFLTYEGKLLFTPLKKLEKLDLSSNSLILLPGDIFEPLLSIQQITLTDNNLVEIPDVTSLVHLDNLFLGKNSLTSLSEYTINMLEVAFKKNDNFSLSLYGNTLSCGCSSLYMLMWLNETRMNLDGKNYSCMTSQGKLSYTSFFSDVLLLNRMCNSSFWLNVTIAGFGLLLIFIFTAFVFVKNRMKIRLFLLRLIGNNICPRQRNEFLYDVSILHDESSRCLRFVTRELRDELCIHRGFNVNQNGHPDRFHTMAIGEDIRDSWKIVLIITDEFLNSNICMFTMCTCLSAITLTTPNKVIVMIDRDPVFPTNVHFFMDSISEENIFHVDLSAPLSSEFWDHFATHLTKEEVQ